MDQGNSIAELQEQLIQQQNVCNVNDLILSQERAAHTPKDASKEYGAAYNRV